MHTLTSSLRATTFLCATALTLSAFTTQAHAVTLTILADETVTLEGTSNGVSIIDGGSTIAAGGTLISNDARNTRQTGDLLNEGSIEMQGRRYFIVPDATLTNGATLTNKGSITIDEGTDFEAVQGVLDNTEDGTIINNGRTTANAMINNGDIENNGVLSVLGRTATTSTGSITNTGLVEVSDNNAGDTLLSGANFTQTDGQLRVNGEMDFDTVQITGGTVQGIGTIGGDVEVTGARIIGGDGASRTLNFSDRLTVQESSILQFAAAVGWAVDPISNFNNGIDVAGPVALAAGTVFDIDVFVSNWDPRIPGRFDWDLLIADSFEFTDLDGLIFDYGSNADIYAFGSRADFNPAARYTTSIFDMADGRQSVRLSVEAIAPVPLPASVLLLLGGLAGLGALSRRRRASS
ncbi:VPLPA-CTERM sorting domain-containing protein [Yoonia sp.]|uniref:VPLPA-CTERM sorting domain-containing protein n=1 Tax=Yoonia sp. TaxID=2212373 RepID=UPI003F6B0283